MRDLKTWRWVRQGNQNRVQLWYIQWHYKTILFCVDLNDFVKMRSWKGWRNRGVQISRITARKCMIQCVPCPWSYPFIHLVDEENVRFLKKSVQTFVSLKQNLLKSDNLPKESLKHCRLADVCRHSARPNSSRMPRHRQQLADDDDESCASSHGSKRGAASKVSRTRYCTGTGGEQECSDLESAIIAL